MLLVCSGVGYPDGTAHVGQLGKIRRDEVSRCGKDRWGLAHSKEEAAQLSTTQPVTETSVMVSSEQGAERWTADGESEGKESSRSRVLGVVRISKNVELLWAAIDLMGGR